MLNKKELEEKEIKLQNKVKEFNCRLIVEEGVFQAARLNASNLGIFPEIYWELPTPEMVEEAKKYLNTLQNKI